MKCLICETLIGEPENFYWTEDVNGSDAPIHPDCLIRALESEGETEAATEIFKDELTKGGLIRAGK